MAMKNTAKNLDYLDVMIKESKEKDQEYIFASWDQNEVYRDDIGGRLTLLEAFLAELCEFVMRRLRPDDEDLGPHHRDYYRRLGE